MTERSPRRAVAFSALHRYGEAVIVLAALAILARLLPPEAFGIYAVGLSVISLLTGLAEFGQSDFVVADRALNQARRGTALGLSFASTLICSVLLAAAVLFLPEGLINPTLREVLLVLTGVILVRPLLHAYLAPLTREMNFSATCRIGLIRAFGRASSSIAFAWYGFGAAGLALGFVIGEFLGLVAAALISPASLPRPSLKHVGEVVQFGSLRTGIGFIAQFGKTAATIAVSQLLGFGAAGLLDRSERITGLYDRLLLSAVRPVILPLLSGRLRRDQDVGDVYLMKAAFISAITWPFVGFLVFFAKPIVALLLGPAWLGAVPVVQVLCLVGIAAPLHHMNDKFFIALGMMPVLLRRQLILLPVTLAVIVTGALVSLELATAGFVFASFAKAAMDFGPLARRMRFGSADLAAHCRDSLGVTVFTLLPVLPYVAIFGPVTPQSFGGLAICAVGSALGWLAGLAVTGHPMGAELERILNRIPRRRRSANDSFASEAG